MRRPSSFSSSFYSDDSQDPQDSQYPQDSSNFREDSEADTLSRLREWCRDNMVTPTTQIPPSFYLEDSEASRLFLSHGWLNTMMPLLEQNSFNEKLEALMHELMPLFNVETGESHPEFPRCVIHFWLLDNEQLDSLMEFYHQKPGTSYWKDHYPKSVGWEENLSLARKRRRFGRFIGLRGCESPVVGSFPKEQWLEPESHNHWLEPEPDNHRLEPDNRYADQEIPYSMDIAGLWAGIAGDPLLKGIENSSRTSDARSSPSDNWRLDLISQYSKQPSPSLHSVMSLLSNPAPGYWELMVSYWEETQEAKLKRRTS